MAKNSGLTVRQFEREAVELPVELAVCELHREQVRFSPMSSAPEAHVTRGTATDMSSGGMRLVCEQFVPRMCEAMVRVFDPQAIGTASDGSPIREVAFEHRVRIRRTTLESHDPRYGLGVAFVEPEPDIEQRIAALLSLAQPSSEPPPEPGGVDA